MQIYKPTAPSVRGKNNSTIFSSVKSLLLSDTVWTEAEAERCPSD